MAAAGVAQSDPVLLRLRPPPAGQAQHLQTVVEVWLTAAPADSTPPILRLTQFSARSGTRDDSGLVFTDVIDSSRIETPSSAGGQVPPPRDMLRSLRTVTRLDDRGRSVAARIQYAPQPAPEDQFMLRALQPLAVAGTRLAIIGLPEQPVRPGDSWTDSLRFDLSTDQATSGALVTVGGTGNGRYRLERVETRGTSRVAILTAVGEVRAAGSTEPIAATARMELDVDTGLLLRSDAELSGLMTTRMGSTPARVRLSQRAW